MTMRCPICSEEVRDTDQAERWGPEFAHATCVTAYNAGKADERERLRDLLVSHRDQTVMSHHVTLAECHAARNALQLVLDELA